MFEESCALQPQRLSAVGVSNLLRHCRARARLCIEKQPGKVEPTAISVSVWRDVQRGPSLAHWDQTIHPGTSAVRKMDMLQHLTCQNIPDNFRQFSNILYGIFVSIFLAFLSFRLILSNFLPDFLPAESTLNKRKVVPLCPLAQFLKLVS
jgi:hypothetical protein